MQGDYTKLTRFNDSGQINQQIGQRIFIMKDKGDDELLLKRGGSVLPASRFHLFDGQEHRHAAKAGVV